ncbi:MULTISPECIES: carboxymuconolactone decarboxylase family protein [Acinetobacter]|uniref:Carboxymuconolactone decarboxylase family protein n=1 Tax=Acinetobacter junii TaxID=40215 RepID=A0A365PLX5_ACIJU|nr:MULTISPECIES: carboxymuconolactone decarboxylase family protein [Acinetobacter]RBA38047.1 carboxymuconolactone decarboxylase family protein [Acinetobacter junii]RBA38926.1 carboxymuconolactone decarboxylase family protein [Acinetobacter junii]RBA49609.1 carboxymuconolactone decarboxylase family protein [Acinetobacter junii]WLF74242.1 carboxymuconolactone decarboxylase family protein [Acinetobacter junii]
MQDWNNYRDSLLQRVGEYAQLAPDVMKAIGSLEPSIGKMGKLDAKTHELIALAVAVTTRCDACIAVHSKKAIELGVSREEIAEALSVAIALNAGTALTYSARVLEAVDSVSQQ